MISSLTRIRFLGALFVWLLGINNVAHDNGLLRGYYFSLLMTELRSNFMHIGLNFGYRGSGHEDGVALAKEAERLGYHSQWTAEACGSDSVTHSPIDRVAGLD